MLQLKTSYRDGREISRDPLVQCVDNFLSTKECDHFIAITSNSMERSVLGVHGNQQESSYRTGQMHWLKKDHDRKIRAVAKRLSKLVKVPVGHAESFQMISYARGEEYKPHLDAFDPDTPIGQSSFSRGGQRIITCLFYLNDVEQGGGTKFPELGVEIEARRGRLVIFHNVKSGSLTERDPRLLHCGMPVLAGEKWACSFWFHSEPWK
jgi:prolyl 4-hydroxylase